MDAEMSQFAADLLQSVREMKADVRARETKVNISDVIEQRVCES